MFIEVVSKHNPLLIAVPTILMVGTDDKKGTFIVTADMDVVIVEEGYETVKERIFAAIAD